MYQNIASNSVFNSISPASSLLAKLVPEFVAINFSGHQPNFTINGADGLIYIVQSSTDLVVWSNVFTNTPGAMPFTWTDVVSGNSPQKFYRALLAP